MLTWGAAHYFGSYIKKCRPMSTIHHALLKNVISEGIPNILSKIVPECSELNEPRVDLLPAHRDDNFKHRKKMNAKDAERESSPIVKLSSPGIKPRCSLATV